MNSSKRVYVLIDFGRAVLQIARMPGGCLRGSARQATFAAAPQQYRFNRRILKVEGGGQIVQPVTRTSSARVSGSIDVVSRVLLIWVW
jgi:hypothetical protein